uniref:UBZ1-type domain-containing protein n=1 Tax=Oreochromis aureus TaxID=47969 RepID=A0A668SIK3_OREAU
MQSLFGGGGELGLLGGGGDSGGLKEDGCGSVAWRSSPLPHDEVYSTSHFALITAYQDIKTRLACLERENTSIKRKLKIYEIKVKSFSLLMSNITANSDSHSCLCPCWYQTLQKRKEREEQLEDVIKAYEKIHMEKNNLQRDLDKMVRGIIQFTRFYLFSFLPVLDCPALTLQSSRSLDALSDLKLQRLEAELEGARHEAQGACQREEELKAECERLKDEMRQLQNSQRCDVEWIKKVGDEQVNLALAYTELTEELGRLRALSSKQMEILRKATQEQLHSPIHHQRHSPVSQRHSPIPQRHSPVPPPPHHSPIQQRRSPVLQRLSPDMHRRSPLLDVNDGPASYSCRPPSQHLRASFQGRRSYSEVADPSAYQCPPRFSLDPVSTLPKPRPYVESGAGGDGEVAHLHFEPPPPSTPEEWTCPHPISPPRTLGVLSAAVPSGVMRGPASCSAFPVPQRSNTLTCHPQPGYMSAEHAQSWPSINLWMETEESDMRSCPLCQLIFPVGYPDDALIKHIDSHLENSKI